MGFPTGDLLGMNPMLYCYRQAMDVAGLSKLSGDTITLIVGILGSLVTKTRLLNAVPQEFGFAVGLGPPDPAILR